MCYITCCLYGGDHEELMNARKAHFKNSPIQEHHLVQAPLNHQGAYLSLVENQTAAGQQIQQDHQQVPSFQQMQVE